jgi:hypothetical protein
MIKSKMILWAQHNAVMRATRNAYKDLVQKPEEKRSLGEPRHRSENNIKIDTKEIIWWGVGACTRFVCLRIGSSSRLV